MSLDFRAHRAKGEEDAVIVLPDAIIPNPLLIFTSMLMRNASTPCKGLVRISYSTVKIDDHLKQAIGYFSNLKQLFNNANIVNKRKIIGSIFTKKLVFDGKCFRTTRVNEVVQLICNMDKAFTK